VAERVRVRKLGSQQGNRLLRIVRRSTRPVVTWRRAQMVPLSAQGMDATQIRRYIAGGTVMPTTAASAKSSTGQTLADAALI
jgi:hypothetical protein